MAPIFAAARKGVDVASQDPWRHELIGRQSSCWHGVWGEPKGSQKVLALDVRNERDLTAMCPRVRNFKLISISTSLTVRSSLPRGTPRFRRTRRTGGGGTRQCLRSS
jgi:hypothetical protein